jgi:dihydrofolate synthase / folylpolyglutamate synthase
MSYAAAIDNLYALGVELAPLSIGTPRRKFDLAHMRILAEALGAPQKAFPSVLIAGTNGKGSTAATLASILTAAGYRTGLYTSPHLLRVNERIQINGIQIPDEEFARLYFQVDETGRRLVESAQLPHPPSFFEVLTAVAFLHFAGRDALVGGVASEATTPAVDIAVLEVGLGGRLDATNIVDPLLSILTDIALDHQEYLGSTIAEITREKAGILRPNGTLITLPQHPEANQAIGEAAASLNLRAINAASYIPHTSAKGHLDERHIETFSDTEPALPAAQHLPPNRYNVTVDGQSLEVNSPLLGHHQRRNIALAIAAAVELRNHNSYKMRENTLESNHAGYKISNTAIEAGIRNTRWPGRLELFRFAEGPELLVDVAHNPAGAWTLRAAIAELAQSRPRTLIFSCLRDKDLNEMAQILFPLFDASSGDSERGKDHIIFAPIDNPRAASLQDLLAAAHALDVPAHAAPHLAAALAQARDVTPPGGLIIATGSVYLVGEVRHLAEELGSTLP